MVALHLRDVTLAAIIFRIMAAILVGGLVGLERGRKNRPAGLRTYMLVCVGSCLIMLTNQYIYQVTSAGDPMRLGAQVVSGIGFLGAGTIVVTKRNQIKGLTTAAGLWASAGVGLALGIGFYEGAFVSTAGIYLILTVLHQLEAYMNKKVRLLEIYLELSNTIPLSELTRQLRALDLTVEGVQVEPNESINDSSRAVIVVLKAKKREDHAVLLESIRTVNGVIYLEEL